MPSAVAEYILDTTPDLPTLPTVATLALEIALDDSSSASDLAEIVGHDPSLAAKILKVANSAAFTPRGRISALPHAVTFLGFTTVRNLILGVSVFDTCCQGPQGALDHTPFWLHSVACATLVHRLVRRSSRHDVEEYFVSGLLHDIGKVVMALHSPETFRSLLARCRDTGTSTTEVEMDLFGVSHPEVGAALAHRWRLPDVLRDAIGRHHDLPSNSDPHALPVCVNVADLACWGQGLSSVPTHGCVPSLNVPEAVGFDPKQLEHEAQAVSREVAAIAEAFGLRRYDIARHMRALQAANRRLSHVNVGLMQTVYKSADEREQLRIERDELRLQTEALGRLSTTDALTGLRNRRHFDELVSFLLDKHQRDAQPLSVIFLDLDNFKRLNDRHGHMAGDDALVRVAELLRRTIRSTDAISRVGGDEFAILLDGADETRARKAAARIGREVVRLWRVAPYLRELTISLGVAELREGESAAELVQRADQAMYDAKRSGGNRLCIAGHDGEPQGPLARRRRWPWSRADRRDAAA